MKLRLAAAAAVLALVTAPVATGQAAAARPALPARAPIAAGSFLMLVDHGPVGDFGVTPTSQTLELVSPTGARTTIYTRATPDTNQLVSLEGWSTDGSTALLSGGGRHGERLFRVDVGTGAVTRIPASLVAGAVLDPSGAGVIAERFLLDDPHGRLGLMRIAWDGTLTPLHAFVDGAIIAAGHGTVVTGGDRPGAHALRAISLRTGRVLRSLATRSYCQPVRQWDARHVLVRCGNVVDLFAPGSGVLTQLAPRPGHGDQYEADARRLGGTTYVEVGDVCDVDSLAKVAHGRLHPVPVPGVDGGVNLVATAGSDLVLWHTGPCYSRSATVVPSGLSLFDPVARTDRPLVTMGSGEEIARVAALGQVRALHP